MVMDHARILNKWNIYLATDFSEIALMEARARLTRYFERSLEPTGLSVQIILRKSAILVALDVFEELFEPNPVEMAVVVIAVIRSM